jgi:hypothetical protein
MASGGYVYHVLNRAVARARLFINQAIMPLSKMGHPSLSKTHDEVLTSPR